jgi:effector-binding domain-containing protein
MASCDRAHAEFDGVAAGRVQTGTLPEWTSVHGKVAWSLSKGAYEKLPAAWDSFVKEAMSRETRGPAGDVYLCTPGEHAPERMLTILYVPVR